jgi:hypothetical protein
VTQQWLELRVHGVHGTTPASLLGVKDVDQVAGDGLTGFYRAPAGTPLPYRAPDDSVAVEAYSWGALTSGVAGFFGWVKRVLWLLLVPFALVNLAYWARLSLTHQGPRGRFTAAAVRLSALILTVFFVCSVSFVAVDLFSWQCFRGGVASCPSLPGWLQSLASLRPGIRLAIGMLIPLAVVLVLWALARTTLARYEATEDPSAADDSTVWRGSPPVLSERGLWSATTRTTELRNLHVAAGLATVTTLVAGHAWREAGLTSSAGSRVSFLVIGVLGVAVLVLSAWGCVRVDDGYSSTRPAGWAWLTSGSGTLSLVTLALLVLQPRSAYDEYVDFSFHDQMFVVLFVALTVLHLCVFSADRIEKSWWWCPPIVALVAVVGGYLVTLLQHDSQHLDLSSKLVWACIGVLVVLGVFATWWHFRGAPSRDHQDKAWNGAGASVMMASAAWIALLFTTAGVTGVATFLNGGESVARLTTSVEPYGETAPTVEELHSFTLQGPIDIRALRVRGPKVGYVVTATSAWLTPSDPEDTEERFYVVSGTYDAAMLRMPVGTRLSHDGRHSSILGVTRVRPADVLVLELSGDEHSALVLPPVLIWAPIAQLFWILMAAILLIGCWVTFRWKVAKPLYAKRDVDDLFTSRDFRPDGRPWRITEADRGPVLSARTSAAMGHRAESLLNWIGVITAPIALVLVGLSSTKDYVALTRSAGALSRTLAYSTNLSLLVVLGFSAALVLLGSKVRADEGWRKNVGVIWDLTTFWPRAAHPLAPPCYAERVIPELLTRVHWARRRASVVISAHSQGSLIAVAMLMRLTDLSGIRLVTYGSQVRGLYGRVFPRVFGPQAIPYQPTVGPIRLTDPFPDLPKDDWTPGDVHPGHLSPLVDDGRWVNLFRRADPLGYRVFSDTPGDARDRVVNEVPSAEYGDAGPAVLGHSGYQHSPEYRSLISDWTGATWVGVPDPPEVASPLPGH